MHCKLRGKFSSCHIKSPTETDDINFNNMVFDPKYYYVSMQPKFKVVSHSFSVLHVPNLGLTLAAQLSVGGGFPVSGHQTAHSGLDFSLHLQMLPSPPQRAYACLYSLGSGDSVSSAPWGPRLRMSEVQGQENMIRMGKDPGRPALPSTLCCPHINCEPHMGGWRQL